MRHRAVFTYLGHRVAQGDQGKYSHVPTVSLTNLTNVNDPLPRTNAEAYLVGEIWTKKDKSLTRTRILSTKRSLPFGSLRTRRFTWGITWYECYKTFLFSSLTLRTWSPSAEWVGIDHWAGNGQVKNTNIKIYLNTLSSKPDPYRPNYQFPMKCSIDRLLVLARFLALAQ
jgi:hypothetical protein